MERWGGREAKPPSDARSHLWGHPREMRESSRKHCMKAGRHLDPSRALRKQLILASDSTRATPSVAQDTSRAAQLRGPSDYRAGRTHPTCPVSHLAGGGVGAKGSVTLPADLGRLESRDGS